MKKVTWVCVVFFMVMGITASSYAEAESTEEINIFMHDKIGYIGAGASLGLDAFSTNYKFDEPTGFNLRLGFFWDVYHSEIIELEINHVGPFKSQPHGAAEVDITSYILAMRHDLNDHDRFRIFFSWGVGALVADVETKTDVPGIGDSDADFCIKGALGADVFVTDTIALGIEAATYPGFARVREFSYYNFTLGMKYYF